MYVWFKSSNSCEIFAENFVCWVDDAKTAVVICWMAGCDMFSYQRVWTDFVRNRGVIKILEKKTEIKFSRCCLSDKTTIQNNIKKNLFVVIFVISIICYVRREVFFSSLFLLLSGFSARLNANPKAEYVYISTPESFLFCHHRCHRHREHCNPSQEANKFARTENMNGHSETIWSFDNSWNKYSVYTHYSCS